MNEELKNVQTLNDNEMNEAAGGAGQAHWITYVIKRGDTLTKIAHRYSVTVANLCQWNGISNPFFFNDTAPTEIYTTR